MYDITATCVLAVVEFSLPILLGWYALVLLYSHLLCFSILIGRALSVMRFPCQGHRAGLGQSGRKNQSDNHLWEHRESMYAAAVLLLC
jgi:hypothetical protein